MVIRLIAIGFTQSVYKWLLYSDNGLAFGNRIVQEMSMGIGRLITALALVCSSAFVNTAIANDEPPVKMSKSGICHERGSTYYNKTKNYTAFNTLEECLRAGGRKPKR